MNEAPAQLQMIAEGSEYELLSTPDLSIFALRFKLENLTARLEDEDAARFRQDYETIRDNFRDGTRTRPWHNFGIKAAIAGLPHKRDDENGTRAREDNAGRP